VTGLSLFGQPMGVSSGTLAFAYTLPPFRSVTGLSPVSYRPCRSHLPKLRLGPRFVKDQGNRGPAAKQWGLRHLEEVRKKQGLARRRTGVSRLSAVPTQAATSKTAV
jgi:hypothetical protein